MYAVVTTKKYRKTLRSLSRSGRQTDIKKLEKAVSILANGKTLPVRFRDHSLAGDLAGYRECHIKNDLLLMYYKKEKELVLVLARLGGHDDLFK